MLRGPERRHERKVKQWMNRRRRKGGGGREEILEEITAKNFPKLDQRFQLKRIHRQLIKTFKKKKKKPTPRHIIMKPKNIREGEPLTTEEAQTPSNSRIRKEHQGGRRDKSTRKLYLQDSRKKSPLERRGCPFPEARVTAASSRGWLSPRRRVGSSQGHTRAEKTQRPSGAAPWGMLTQLGWVCQAPA